MSNVFNIRVAKAQADFAIDFASLPAVSQNFIIEYGFKQLLNDSTASHKIGNEGIATQEDLVEFAMNSVQGKIDALEAGTIGTRATAERDPFKAAMREGAVKMLNDALKSKGIKIKDVDKAAHKAKVDSILADEKHKARLEAYATEKLAAAQKVGTVDIDLDDLGSVGI